MAKHWSLGRPQLQARVQPTGDDGSDDHKLTLTVTFDITPDSAGSETLAEARSRDLLRLAIPSWLTPDVTIPVVVVPNVLGYNERAADDALREAELEPVHGPTGHLGASIIAVTTQSPEGGTWASPGSLVSLEYGEGENIPTPYFPRPLVICDPISCEDPLHDPRRAVRIQLELGEWHA